MASHPEQLKAKLAARDKVPGYEKNCGALRAEIERLEHAAANPHPSDGEL